MIKNTSKLPNKFHLKHYYHTAEHILAWVAAGDYDVCRHVSVYPDTFSFTHDTTTQMYDLVKDNPRQWACVCHGDNPKHASAFYTASEIAEHFEQGHWKLVEEAPKESVTKERELVFPFTFYCALNPRTTYVAIGEDEYGVEVNFAKGDYTSWPMEKALVKKIIDEGKYVVTSVGPQAAPELVKELDSAAGNFSGTIDFTVGTFDSSDVLKATERLERLASAMEAVNISLESFQVLLADVQDMLGSGRACEAEDTQERYFDFSSFIKCD